MRIFIHISLVLIIFLSSPLKNFGQSGHTLQGVVVDSKTREPVPFASVFLSMTMIGTRTSESGTYSLNKIPAAKYDLTVSSVGYKTAKYPVRISEKTTTLNISLEPEVKVLNEVVVKSIKYSKSEYKNYKEIFRSYLLGQTPNAAKCKIVNIDSINFIKDEGVLTASCTPPIEIINKALGYRVFYYLESFVLDYRSNLLSFSGTPFFKPLDENGKDFKFTKTRDMAYYGSLNHFMRALRTNKLYSNDFSVYIRFPRLNKTLPRAILPEVYNNNSKAFPDLSSYLYYEVSAKTILKAPYETLLNLMVVYTGSDENNADQWGNLNRGGNTDSRHWIPEYLLPSGQMSWLKYLAHNLVIHENGYYEDQTQYFISGYWDLHGRIAEWLPFEYEPVLTKKEIARMEKLEKLDSARLQKAMLELQ